MVFSEGETMKKISEQRLNILLENLGIRVKKNRKRLYEQEDDIDKKYEITSDGSIFLYRKGLTSLKDLNLPERIEGSFDCSFNRLTTLEGAPKEVGKDFNCSNNNLRDLRGAPTKGDNLESFDCSNNKLRTLEGAPRKVNWNFDCSFNELKDLRGAPHYIGNDFDCSYNKLESLKGAPRDVAGSFICSYNELTSLEGIPRSVGENFDCRNNAVEFTKEEILEKCDVAGIIFV